MELLRELCCGWERRDGRVAEMLKNLGDIIHAYGEEFKKTFISTDENQKKLYGFFVSRKLLEAAYASFLLRFDPVRFLILRNYQMKAGYSHSERHMASIDWSKDFVPTEKVQIEKEVSSKDFVRALLGGHLGDSIWSQSISAIDKKYSTGPCPQYITDIISPWYDDNSDLKKTEVILNIYRQESQSIFSSLSKGVHLEFIVKEDTKLDPVTIDETMTRAITLIMRVGFILSFSDTILNPIESSHVERIYSQLIEDLSL